MIKHFNNNESFSCSLYILSSEKGNLLIDPGFYNKEIKNYIKSLGGLDAILITHGHWDHIYEINAIKKDNPEAKIYIHEKEKEFFYNPVLNGMSEEEIKSISEITDINLFNEGKIKAGGYDVEIFHTPGHTAGSSIFWFKDENVLFTGDFILEEDIGRIDLPTSSRRDMFNSVEKFKKLEFPGDMKVYFGHCEHYFTYKELMEINEYLR
ncbi:MAG: MBL fold metallo-hydrolase [Bacteroidales bacterium]|jgi:glyoxylase-like metal-dependent hydrolase (beta-lactamase superfamily II)|nr:MBL fold metallo-hydrolase [Bacteroidales bacterium]